MDRTGAYAVIGAGPHGLSALKALLQNGIDADGFEREAEVGGNWNFGAENSRVYQSTHLISSKPFTQFPDFPMPDRFPDYPSHAQIKEYFTSYARHFGLRRPHPLRDRRRAGRAGRRRRHVARHDPRPGQRRRVRRPSTRASSSPTATTGIPKMPHYPGQESFGGEIIHSAHYKGADILRGRRVLVVGRRATPAATSPSTAPRTRPRPGTRRGAATTTTRSSSWAGRATRPPTCCSPCACRWPLRRQAFKTTLKLTVGDFAKFGLKKPDHEFFETHPIVNQQLVYYVGHGDITPVDDIDHFDADGVVFTDGRRADVDLVVFCTGYLVTFPFLPDAEEQLNWQVDHPVLALQVFTPRHRNLFVSGLIQPDSGQWTLAHWQGMTIARFIEATRERPAVADRFFRAVTARGRAHVHRRHDLQGLEPALLRGRPPGLPRGAAVRDPRARGRAMSARGARGTAHARHAAVGLVAAAAAGEPPRGHLGAADRRRRTGRRC